MKRQTTPSASPAAILRTRLTDGPRRGIALLAVIAAMAALALTAGVIALLAASDARIAARYKRMMDAFYAADAGVSYVKGCIESDLASGSVTLTSPVESVNYTAPAGLGFDPVTQLTRAANTNIYLFRVTGRMRKAECTLEVTFRRRSVFEIGYFGDEEFDAKPYGSIYSYDSSITTNPTPDDSTGEVLAACNEDFLTYQDTFIDGSFELGTDPSGTDGAWRETPPNGSDITGEAGTQTDRIDPDPLGAASGDLAAEFTSVAANNDDDTAVPPITPPKYDLKVSNGGTAVLSSGNYYIHDIILNNGAALTIDSASGPVNVYLTGSMEAKAGSAINFTGDPPDFNLYCNSDESIILKNDGDFKGVIYAPFADIEVKNSANFFGICWGGSVEIKNSGEAYMDIAAMRKYPSDAIALLSWKEVRN